jgi:tetratricopeptide (TPR) repeat protein
VTNRSPSVLVATVALSVVLLAAAVQLQAARERAYPPVDVTEDSLALSSASVVRRLTGAYNNLFADVYWIRAIQYYGGTKQKIDAAVAGRGIVADPPASLVADAFPVLYPLLDITTTLDPRFNIAYRFGSVFLAEPYPRGADRPDLAVALLEKGLRERPDKWQYLQDIGFVYYWFRHDYLTAAEWFRKAADVPGAPSWLRLLAATTLAQGGDRASSRTMWTAILQTAETEWQRKEAQRRLIQLQALDMIDELQRALDEYGRRTGVKPDWRTLVGSRVLRGIPVDPTGTPFDLLDGRVQLSKSSALWPPPEEPAAAGQPRS